MGNICMVKKKIKEAVDVSLNTLIIKDKDLLVFDVNERSITHKLALYLEQHFSNWHIDCEYNRNMFDPKVIDLYPRTVGIDDTNATTVYPDIIVHKRGTKNNLLVIEVKKVNISL
jgi:hypothetical protein